MFQFIHILNLYNFTSQLYKYFYLFKMLKTTKLILMEYIVSNNRNRKYKRK